MKQEFYKIKAIDLCLSVFDGTHDSPKYFSEGYPLVTSKYILNNKIDYSSAPLVSKDDFDFINKRRQVEINDVLVSMIGTVGNIAIVRDKPIFAIKNIGVLRAKNTLDAQYLLYYMQCPIAQNEILNSLAGSTQPFLSLGQLRNFQIRIPVNREFQQHIVNTISSLLLKFL